MTNLTSLKDDQNPDLDWSPTVGLWAGHDDHGTVLVLEVGEHDCEVGIPVGPAAFARSVVARDSLTKPVLREWFKASQVPAHVVVEDQHGNRWARWQLQGIDFTPDAYPLREVNPEPGASR